MLLAVVVCTMGPNVGVEDGACEYMTYLTVHENRVR